MKWVNQLLHPRKKQTKPKWILVDPDGSSDLEYDYQWIVWAWKNFILPALDIPKDLIQYIFPTNDTRVWWCTSKEGVFMNFDFKDSNWFTTMHGGKKEKHRRPIWQSVWKWQIENSWWQHSVEAKRLAQERYNESAEGKKRRQYMIEEGFNT